MFAGSSRWAIAYLIVVAAFLGAVAKYYHPGSGFTFFIEFPANRHDAEIAAVQSAPHVDHPNSDGYDGQFHAQMATDPLLKDPAIDRAVVDITYRARRILFSWTAYVVGLGRPAWILQVFAVQNVVAWIFLAWLLCRWFPPTSARTFVLWTGCLLSPGVLASVRYALPDLPSVLLVASGVALLEAGRPVLSALTVGFAGLGRETTLLAAGLFASLIGRSWRSWLLATACVVVCVLPFALWFDYLRSIYRANVLAAGINNFAAPLSALVWKLGEAHREFQRSGFTLSTSLTITSLLSFGAQAGCVLWACAASRRRRPWALTAAPFILLALVLGQPVWEGSPGAYTRVLSPLTIGANAALLAAPSRASWILIGLANLGAIPAAWWFATSSPP